MRSISSTIAAVPASSVAELSLRWRGHARSRYRPKVDGQRQHAQGIGRRRAVDDDVVPVPRSGQLADLVKTENLLNSRKRRKFLRGNMSQVGLVESRGQHAGDVAPSRLEQRQRVERERVEESTPGIRVVGEHPRRLTKPGGYHGCAENIAERVRLVGGHHEDPQAALRVAHRGRGRQRRLTYAALANEETDPGVGRRGGFTQPRLVS